MDAGSIRRWGAAGAALVLTAALATGCSKIKDAVGPASPGVSTAAVEPGVATGPSGGKLLSVHDPKQVTYTLQQPASCHFLSGPRPDPACTPGAIDPSVTQADIQQTICDSGYTKTVRPAESETNQAKDKEYTEYAVADGTKSELDHLVPLELGGANDIANLWPEVGKIPNPKDKVENTLHDAVCSGKVQLAAAQQAIAQDWTTAESVLGVSDQGSDSQGADAGE